MKRVEGRASRVESRTPVLIFQNRQREKALNIPLLRRVVRFVLEEEFRVRDYELGFHFVIALEMARVNEQFLQHEGSTDVITFDHGSSAQSLHGEIFISVPDAVTQAREFKTSWQSETARYVIHGLLHLCGYDDLQPAKRREMKREEKRLMKVVVSRFDVRELARTRNAKPRTRN